jgi:hypothetical protein
MLSMAAAAQEERRTKHTRAFQRLERGADGA